MQVKLVNARMENLLLPYEMAVQGYPVQIEVPGVEIEGRDGRAVNRKAKRVKPTTVTITGTIDGMTKDEADKLRNAVVGFAYNANPICIYRHAEADTYVVGDLISVDHAYRTGYFGGRLFTLGLQFSVSDPFHYSAVLTQETNPTTVTNNGMRADPIVWLCGPATNPMVSNIATGQTVQFTGNVATGSIIGIDCARFQANIVSAEEMESYGTLPEERLAGASVLSQMNDGWLINGFSLIPGDNTFEASGVAEWRLVFRERWL